jgi:hypothetical protein
MAWENGILDIALEAATAFTSKQYYCVKLDSNGKAALATGGGTRIVGVMQDDPDTGEAGAVRVMGISKVVAGKNFTYNALLTADSGGEATDNVTSGDFILGISLSSVATGETATVLLTPGARY